MTPPTPQREVNEYELAELIGYTEAAKRLDPRGDERDEIERHD